MEPPWGIVVAGGASRRMGQDKATLVLDGRPLLRWVTEALVEGGCERLVVSVRDEIQGAELDGLLADWTARVGIEVDVVSDDPLMLFAEADDGGRSVRAALRSGLSWAAAHGAERVQLAPVDVAHLDPRLVGLLAEHAGTDVAVPRLRGARDGDRGAAGLEPLLAHGRAVSMLRGLVATAERGDRRLVAAWQEAGMVEVPPEVWVQAGIEAASFTNINTPEDFK